MKYGALIIETKENDNLIQMIGMSHNRKDETYQASVAKLLSELRDAKKLNADEMPADVVRLNSTVKIAFPDGKERTVTLVSPEKSDVASNKISILAPMGLALIGYAADDQVMWQFPNGLQAIKILSVQQTAPETKIA